MLVTSLSLSSGYSILHQLKFKNHLQIQPNTEHVAVIQMEGNLDKCPCSQVRPLMEWAQLEYKWIVQMHFLASKLREKLRRTPKPCTVFKGSVNQRAQPFD